MLLAGIPFRGILFTVFQSIFQVFLVCLAGFVLSFKGIVDKPTSKALNHINIALCTPALLFSKVAFFLTPGKLRQLWIIPIFFVVLTGLSAVIAHWLARACRLKRSQVNFATAASMFMNSNSLPVALMQSLATTVPLLKWGPDDTVDAMFGRSLTYLVVFSTLGMILRWSYGIRLISQIDELESAMPAPTTYRDDIDQHPPLSHVTVDPPATAQLVDYDTETDIDPHSRIVWRTRPLRSRLPHPRLTALSRRHTHLPAVPTSLGDQSESEDTDELETTENDSEETIAIRPESADTGLSGEAEGPTPIPLPPSSSSERADVHPTPRWDQHARRSLLKRLLITVTSLSPPLVGSLLALFCVLVPPVQRLLKSEEMLPFKGALDNAGACSVPLTLIVLGGWFWDSETKQKAKGKHAEGKVKGADGQGNATTNGKGVEPCRGYAVPALVGERQGHLSTSKSISSLRGYHVTSPSRDSSTASLSSMIGAFGDVWMARIYPRSGSVRARRHARDSVATSEADVEPGFLATHTETEIENAENGLGSRSRSDSANGRAQPPHVAASSPASPSSPKSPHPRGTNPPGETLTIFVTLLARMVIVPLVVTPVMVLVSRLGWGGDVFTDPVFIVSSMLLISSPPALTLAQISQRAKAASATAGATGTSANATDADALSPFERLLSRTVFWSYLVLTPPMTIVSVMVGLFLIGA